MKYILELAYKKNSSLIDIPLDQKFSFLVSHLAENYVFTYLYFYYYKNISNENFSSTVHNMNPKTKLKLHW